MSIKGYTNHELMLTDPMRGNEYLELCQKIARSKKYDVKVLTSGDLITLQFYKCFVKLAWTTAKTDENSATYSFYSRRFLLLSAQDLEQAIIKHTEAEIL